jgi:hypothetical protein
MFMPWHTDCVNVNVKKKEMNNGSIATDENNEQNKY